MDRNDLTLDDLFIGGYRLLQSKDGYRFSLDAVLLAAFVPLVKGGSVLDLGCGSGVLPLLLLGRERELTVTALELMEKPYELAKRNMAENDVDVTVIRGDMRECRSYLKPTSFDLIVTNPPFYPLSSGRSSSNREIAAAKTERFWNQPALMETAAALLKDDGKLALIFDAVRMEEIMAYAGNAGLYLERSCVVFAKAAKAPRRVMLQWGKRPAAARDEATLTIYDENGEETPEIKRILKIYDGKGTVPCGHPHRQSR